MSWLTQTPQGVVLHIKVIPRASRTEVGEPMGDALKIRLQAPPVEGKANKALIEFLAKTLDLPRSAVQILGGDMSRHKRILLAGTRVETIQPRLVD